MAAPLKDPSRFEFVQARSVWRELDEPHPQYRCAAFLDPYQGCGLGCRYCFGATEESFRVTDPSLCRVGVKTNAAHLLSKELEKRAGPLPVLIGAHADPYQPAEGRFRVTRQCLELLARALYPIHVLTKSESILQDVDVLAPSSQKGLAIVTVSLCVLKPELTEWLEPLVPPPARRLSLVKTLNRRGVLTGVALAPILPRLTDNPADLKQIFAKAAASGAAYLLPTGFCAGAPDAGRPRFLGFLAERFPGLVGHYEAMLQEGGGEREEWRRTVWEVLSALSEQFRLPLRLPVEDAPAFNTLPMKLWE